MPLHGSVCGEAGEWFGQHGYLLALCLWHTYTGCSRKNAQSLMHDKCKMKVFALKCSAKITGSIYQSMQNLCKWLNILC